MRVAKKSAKDKRVEAKRVSGKRPLAASVATVAQVAASAESLEEEAVGVVDSDAQQDQ